MIGGTDPRTLGEETLKPLRILHVAHQYRPALGGSEQHVINTSEELARRGHHVTVYTTRSLDYRTWRNELPRHEKLDGVIIRRFDTIRRRDFTWKLLDYGYIHYRQARQVRYHPFIMYGSGPISPGLYWNLLRHGSEFDVIHTTTLPYAHVWYTWEAARRRQVPLVITPFIHTHQADIFDVEWFNRAMRGADRVMVMTEVERRYLLQRGVQPARIEMGGVGIKPDEIVPVGLQNWRQRFGIPQEAYAILFIGRRAAYKGLDVLLEAFYRLRQQVPQAVLVLAGPSTAYWEELWARYQHLSGVIDCGRISDEDKGRLLDACDVLVLPSTGESFGIVFVEAWMVERPVIGARAGALADMIVDGQDGLLFEPDDIEGLTAKLRQLAVDPALRRRMAEAGHRKAMAKYTIARVTDQIEDTYLTLARGEQARIHLSAAGMQSISSNARKNGERAMRISLININLVAKDAIGRSLMDKARFFQRRGDQVRIYVQDMSEDIPEDIRPLIVRCSLAQLVGGSDELAGFREHFYSSDLYVYDYPNWYELIESIRGVDRGIVVFDYHGVTPPELWQVETALDLLERSVDELPTLLRYADYGIGHSAFTHGELVAHGFDKDKAFCFPYAIPLEQFMPAPPDPELVTQYALAGKKVLLYVGRMAGNKRVDLLIQALPLIQAQHPEAVLLLVGDNQSPVFAPIVAELEEQVTALGLQDSVIFTGRVEDLAAHYRLADIYVTSSLHEGFCVPLIESMAMGLPIVASDIAAIPHTMGDAGLTFAPEQIDELAEQVIQLLDDPQLVRDLRAKGFERAKGYTLEAFEENWESLLEQALQYHPALTEVKIAATDETPIDTPQPTPSTPSPAAVAAPPAYVATVELPELDPHYFELETQSDVSMHGYAVRSKAPLIGGLIAWVRRNLTSHLKEPYLDPIIDRQVHVNRRLVWELKSLYNRLRQVYASLQSQLDALRTSVAGIPDQLATLRQQLQADLGSLKAQQSQHERKLAKIERQMAALMDDQRAMRGDLDALGSDRQSLEQLAATKVGAPQLAAVQAELSQQIAALQAALEAKKAQDESWQRTEQALEAQRRALQSQEEALQQDIAQVSQAEQSLEAQQSDLAQQFYALRRLLDESPAAVRHDVQAIRQALQGLSEDTLQRIEQVSSLMVPGSQLDSRFNYFVHADTVGGSVDALRAIYGPLVEHFRHSPDVIDLGCGTGVFLQLLQEAEIPSYGVDLDEDSVLLCRKKGLDVRQEEVMAHLASLPDKSVGGIFAAHVIEHVPTPLLWAFIELCHDKLLYGAPLVLVTPNASALSAFYYTFYKDLTHNKPLHPDAIRFLLEAHGFRRTQVSFVSPMPDVLKLDRLDASLATNDVQQQWVQAMNRNLERINELLYGNLDCVVHAVK